MASLLKNTAWYTLGNLLPKASNFLLLPLYSEFIPPEGYGIISAMNVMQLALLIFFPLAINRGIERLFFDYREDLPAQKEFLGTAWLSIVASTFVFFSLCMLFKPLMGKIFEGIPFYPYYFYMLLIVATTSLSLIPRVYLRVTNKALFFMLLSLSEFSVLITLKIYLLVFRGMSAEGFLLANVIANLIFAPFFILYTLKTVTLKFHWKYIKSCLAFSLPMVPTLLAAWVVHLSNRILIERFLDLRELGLYAFSDNLSQILVFLCNGFMLAYGPMFYDLATRKNQESSQKQLFQYNRAFMIFILLLGFGLSLFIKDFTALLNHRYHDCYKLVPILVLGVIISQITGFYNLAIYQSKKTLLIMLLVIGSALLNVGMNFLLIPYFGASGAAYAGVITYGGLFIATYILAKRCYFIPLAWRELGCYIVGLSLIVGLFYSFSVNLWFDLLLKAVVSGAAGALVIHFNRRFLGRIIPGRLLKIPAINQYFSAV